MTANFALYFRQKHAFENFDIYSYICEYFLEKYKCHEEMKPKQAANSKYKMFLWKWQSSLHWKYVRWSSGMSRMLGILILRYNQLWYEIPFVPFCFQLDKIVFIFGIISPILIGFSAKQS